MLINNMSVTDEEKRKQFFELYAQRNNFDPLIPSNWYIQSIPNIMAQKV